MKNQRFISSDVFRPEPIARLKQLPDAQLRKLYRLSHGIWHFGMFMLVATGCTLALAAPSVLAGQDISEINNMGAIAASALFLAAVTLGAFRRTRWGYYLGIALCLLLISVFPIGPIFGIIGLILYISSRSLFGRNVITHEQLCHEHAWRQRRRSNATVGATA